uniref:Uncharacterized protein n=1 Tax=viral metagenome TaxID=1070528 RepID=A0A6C0KZ17_9ZZZZ
MEQENVSWRKTNVNIPKYARFLIFIVFVLFILHSIQKISDFFNINHNTSYTYFIWVSILFFLFAILPIRKSIFSK